MSIFGPPPIQPVPPFRKVMVFIDGGYVRKGFIKLVGHDRIDFQNLVERLRYRVDLAPAMGEITRVYYYDAIVDATEDPQKHNEQNEYCHNVGLIPNFEVKKGRLVKTGSGEYRQKGVDILISIDMLSKAFQNFYDVAFFIGGDDDFVDLMDTLKNLTNKKVLAAVFQHNVSPRLLESFDFSYLITKEDCESLQLRESKTL